MDFEAILDAIGRAKNVVSDVTARVQQFKELGKTISSADEAVLEREIAELEALLPELRRETQAKLRGTD